MRGEWLDPRARRSASLMSQLNGYPDKCRSSQAPCRATGTRLSDTSFLPGESAAGRDRSREVQAWITELSSMFAPSTVRQIYFVLAALMKYAVKDGRINRDPTEGAQMPRKRAVDRGYLSHEQVERLARECGENADLIVFLAYTGLRCGEMAALRVSLIDFVRRRVDVREALTDVRGELIRGTSKTHERRSVPFPAFLDRPLKARAAGRPLDASFFTSSRGLEMRNGNFRKRAFSPALRSVRSQDPRFPTVTVHDLGHTAASLAISAGANVKAVQRMLGHASDAMPLDVYADLFDDDLDHVAGPPQRCGKAGRGQRWSSAPPG